MGIEIAWGLLVDWGLELIVAVWFGKDNGTIFNLSPPVSSVIEKKKFIKYRLIFI